MNRLFLGGAIAALLVATGCALQQPVQNVENAPVTTATGKAITQEQVRQSIVTAGTGLGWRFADAGPGKLEGTLNLRSHTAVIDVPYNATSYSILFKRGDNLMSEGGMIHKNYNGWVMNLDRAIRTEISRL